MTCASCRHHSASSRAKVVDVADEEMELVEFSEEVEQVYVCQHPDKRGQEIGIGADAGTGCVLFMLGGKRVIDTELEKRLSWRDVK